MEGSHVSHNENTNHSSLLGSLDCFTLIAIGGFPPIQWSIAGWRRHSNFMSKSLRKLLTNQQNHVRTKNLQFTQHYYAVGRDIAMDQEQLSPPGRSPWLVWPCTVTTLWTISSYTFQTAQFLVMLRQCWKHSSQLKQCSWSTFAGMSSEWECLNKMASGYVPFRDSHHRIWDHTVNNNLQRREKRQTFAAAFAFPFA